MARPGKTRKAQESGSPRDLAARADRSLKQAERVLQANPDAPAAERAMVQLEQAKVLALLELAEAIRANGKG